MRVQKLRNRTEKDKWKATTTSLRQAVESAEAHFEKAKEKEVLDAAAAAKRAAEAAAREEASRAMSDAKLLLLTELRLASQSLFENTSDTASWFRNTVRS